MKKGAVLYESSDSEDESEGILHFSVFYWLSWLAALYMLCKFYSYTFYNMAESIYCFLFGLVYSNNDSLRVIGSTIP